MTPNAGNASIAMQPKRKGKDGGDHSEQSKMRAVITAKANLKWNDVWKSCQLHEDGLTSIRDQQFEEYITHIYTAKIL
jgi:hypothetical protein